jgi:hypothetical protein
MSNNRRCRRKFQGGTAALADTAEDNFEDDFEFDDDDDDDDEEQGENNETRNNNNLGSFPQLHRPSSASTSTSTVGSLGAFPRLPGPGHRQQQRDTIRLMEQNEESLLNKNYRLAKEYVSESS